jgi:hypothetical protein
VEAKRILPPPEFAKLVAVIQESKRLVAQAHAIHHRCRNAQQRAMRVRLAVQAWSRRAAPFNFKP